jgi:hypothetical protein
MSPAAQAVWDAFNEDEAGVFVDYGDKLAAALRAAADLERQSPWPTSIEGCGARWMRDQILAIAAELEGSNA